MNSKHHIFEWCGASLTHRPPELHREAPSTTLPPHPPNPLHEPLHIFPLPQLLHRIELPCQLLMRANTMHKAMTSTTQPSDLIQLPLLAPPTFESFGMHASRDEMVIRQGNLGSQAEFAGAGAGGCPYRRRGGRGRGVCVEDLG